MTPLPCGQVGHIDIDAAIPMPHLAKNRPGSACSLGNRRDPLLAFLVRADDEGRADFLRDPVGEKRGRVQRIRGNGVEGGKRRIAMQVRVDGYQPVEARRDEPRKASRGHGLSGPEAAILPHVGEVRRDQRHRPCSERAGRIGSEDQAQEALVRPGQRADEIDRLAHNVRQQAHIALAIGKTSYFEHAELPSASVCQPLREGLVSGQGKDQPHRGFL